MATETEEILEYASKQFGSQQGDAAMAEPKTDEPLETPKEPAMGSEEVKDPIKTETPADPVKIDPVIVDSTAVMAEPDYNQWLEKETGGLIKDVNTFKDSLPKISQYETLLQEKEELEKGKITYANPFVKELNELALAGATKDQLKAYVKLNEVGELSELSAIEAKIARLVLVDGYSETVARKKVDRDFPLADLEDDSDEKQIMEDDLRVSSKADLEALSKYKTQLTTVDNPDKERAEQSRLAEVAKAEIHNQLVKQEAPKIANLIQGIGKINLTGKEGDDAVLLDIPFADDYKSRVVKMAEEYFLHNNEPITQEAVNDFAVYAKSIYLSENFDKVAKSIWSHAESVVTERIVNKYENRSGLAPQQEPTITTNKTDDYNSFLERVANGK